MDERQIPIPLEEAAGLSGPLAFNIMLKPAGSLCNLGCAYCYYLDKSGIYGGREPRAPEPRRASPEPVRHALCRAGTDSRGRRANRALI